MRTGVRPGIRAALAVTVALATLTGVTGTADADKRHPVPTQHQVEAAKAAVARKAGDVAAIRADLVMAQNRLEVASQQAEAAAEAYNGAQYRLGVAKKATVDANAAAVAATQRVADERAALVALANQAYQDGSALNSMTVFFSKGGPEEVLDKVAVTQSASDTMEVRYDSFKVDDAMAAVAREKAVSAQAAQQSLVNEAARLKNLAAVAAQDAQNQAAAIAARRRVLINELAKAEKISVSLAMKRQTGLEQIAQEKAAAAAAAQAAAAAAAASVPSYDGPPPPVSSSAAARRAISFAYAQLGEPYLWAAAGPDAWDCSGLTMMAWRNGGVWLPHYSAAQYAQIRHIGYGDLRAGDLVFWGDSPSTIHHVAMYVGNGQILHAPRTGRNVSIDSMYYWIPPNYFGRP